MQKSVPAEPNKDGVETTSYLYAYYFIARKLAELERKDLLSAVSKQFNTHLYTPNATPELPEIINCGPIDCVNSCIFELKIESLIKNKYIIAWIYNGV